MNNLDLLPVKINLENFLVEENFCEKQYHISKPITSESRIDCFGYFREKAEYLICLMPSAQPAAQEVVNPIFHR